MGATMTETDRFGGAPYVGVSEAGDYLVEVAARLGVPKRFPRKVVYGLIYDGRLVTYRHGRVWLIEVDPLVENAEAIVRSFLLPPDVKR